MQHPSRVRFRGFFSSYVLKTTFRLENSKFMPRRETPWGSSSGKDPKVERRSALSLMRLLLVVDDLGRTFDAVLFDLIFSRASRGSARSWYL